MEVKRRECSMTRRQAAQGGADAYAFEGGEADQDEQLMRAGKALLAPPKGREQLVNLLKVRLRELRWPWRSGRVVISGARG